MPLLPGASCQSAGVQDPKGPIAPAERLLLINSAAIMLVVVVPVILATLAFAWWYRASNPRADRSSDLAYEGRIELVVWSIGVHLIFFLHLGSGNDTNNTLAFAFGVLIVFLVIAGSIWIVANLNATN